MVHRMPSGEIAISVDDAGLATVRGGVAQFEIQTMSASDFPDLPNTGLDDYTLILKTGVMRDIIDRTLYAVSPNGAVKTLANGWPGIRGVALDAANRRLFVAVTAARADGLVTTSRPPLASLK